MIPFDLAAIFALLQEANRRAEGAARLAEYSGAAQVLVFGKDTEIGRFLPAVGLPQTLRAGGRWQAFLGDCKLEHCALMPDPGGAGEIAAYGTADAAAQTVVVFLGARPSLEVFIQIAALLPLLGGRLVLERQVLAADGHAQAARDASRRAGALNQALDINRRELQEAYHKVEYELQSRRAAEQKLLEADRRKDEFLAMLAHELRNPLAPIAMAAQVLKIGPASQERLSHTCTVIERQVDHMTHLLDDLLDVARVAGGMVTLAQELLDMRTIVDAAIEQSRPAINRHAHKLSCTIVEQPCWVNGDPTRLVQIVTNLLNNAAKYTLPHGTIELQLEARDNEVALSVGDSGIGIDAQLLPHIFDLFTQGARSPDRSQGGLGLGLALVKSLVERHGGKVQAHSEGAGKGSQFELTLPRARPAVCGGGTTVAMNTSDSKLNILIVDDNEDAAITLAMFLEAKGHRADTAFSAMGALAAVRKMVPRVLLLDIGLPDMDGCALAKELRALPETRDSILIALTGYGHAEDRERSRAAGFDHHLIKPVAVPELTALLDSIAAESP